MREILYLQAGNFSNYIGTHFWNTQEMYQVRDSGGESEIDHDISFTERNNPDGSRTLYPRALIFDWKDNFGTLAQTNALTGIDGAQPETHENMWDRPVDEFRQTRIAKSAYHSIMEAETSDNSGVAGSQASSSEIRYWSDFSHVYYLPRSIQSIPVLPPWESAAGNWKLSQEQFLRYNEDNDLMDTSVRLFLEESDSIQGIQITNDVSSFGGFSAALFSQLRDEFAKATALVFPILSGNLSQAFHIDDHQGTREIINEALYLRSLEEHASICVPVSTAEHWPDTTWSDTYSSRSVYFSSSIISAHVEAATLSFRKKNSQDVFSNLETQFSSYGISSFAEISGAMPVGERTDFNHSLVNFSKGGLDQSKNPVLFSVRDVIRGFGPLEQQKYDKWIFETVKQFKPEIIEAAAYPLTESLRIALRPEALDTVSTLTRLSTSNALAHMFKSYASFVDASLRHRTASAISLGIDTDDMRELVNDLWTIHDRYPTNRYSSDSEG